MNAENLPLVTAVVPVYNHEKYVTASIRSIINQSYRNIELIIINDGSKDRSHEMVLALVEECKQRFTSFEYINRENRGVSATLNQALSMAKGKYLSALASDDVALGEKFSMLVDALESVDDSYAAAFGNASFIDKLGREGFQDVKGNLQEIKSNETYGTFLDFHTKGRNFDYKSKEFGSYQTLLAGNYLPAMSTLLKTACVKDVGGWTVGNALDDWEMWLKLSKRHRLLFIDNTVALYRVHGKNSFDTIKQQMLESSLLLITSEREYCIRSGLMHEWQDCFHYQLYRLLRYGESPLMNKLRELKTVKVLSFIGYLLRARWTKLMNKVSR